METILAYALDLGSKLCVLEESWRRLGGVTEPFLGVCEGSEACVRTSRGVKVTLGKACQRFCDQTGDVLGVLNPPPRGRFYFSDPTRETKLRRAVRKGVTFDYSGRTGDV